MENDCGYYAPCNSGYQRCHVHVTPPQMPPTRLGRNHFGRPCSGFSCAESYYAFSHCVHFIHLPQQTFLLQPKSTVLYVNKCQKPTAPLFIKLLQVSNYDFLTATHYFPKSGSSGHIRRSNGSDANGCNLSATYQLLFSRTYFTLIFYMNSILF